VSSRLATGPQGERIAVVTSRLLPDVEFGHVYLCLGDTIGASIYFLGVERRKARHATSRESKQAQKHAPYNHGKSRQERERRDVPDELLADQEAVELARREQQHEPVDLISRAA